MRGIALWVAVAWMAVGCSFDSGGRIDADGGSGDASVDTPDAAAPDAGPACSRDEDCAVPPNACKLPGSCDPVTDTCTYPDVDCSGEDDECSVGVCDPAAGCVAQPAFEGDPCGDVTACGTFGACGYSDSCDEDAVRTRDCVDYTCSGGLCAGTLRVEEQECMRDTDGDMCGATTCGGFGACGGFSGPCDESGTRSRSCTARECGGGACQTVPFTDTDTCTRGSRDGVHCAPDSCGGYTDCEFSPSNICDEDGIKARVCTSFTCMDEACIEGSAFTDTTVCTRDTGDVVCGVVCTPPGSMMCEDVTCSDGTCPVD